MDLERLRRTEYNQQYIAAMRLMSYYLYYAPAILTCAAHTYVIIPFFLTSDNSLTCF